MATRTNRLVNFRGEPYVTQPELEATVDEIIQQGVMTKTMAIKPFSFNASQMEKINENKDLRILIPGMVFNVFNSATGIAYGDIQYITTGADEGKTYFTISDFANTDIDIGENGTSFTALAFVRGNGEPFPILESGTVE